jgi:beta-lactamase class A
MAIIKFRIQKALKSLWFLVCFFPFGKNHEAQAQTKKTLAKTKASILKNIGLLEGEFAVAYKDLKSKKTIFINENLSFHAASTMKTPVMIEVFKQAKEGRFKLEDSILVKNEFKSIVDGSPYQMHLETDSDDSIYKMIGQKMTLLNLVYQMITVSSNLATNILIDLVGAKNANTTIKTLGTKHLEVLRGVEDSKAFSLGLNNSTTALDLLMIFEKLAEKKVVSDTADEAMIEILKAQKFNDIIPALLPKKVKIAHKTGSIVGVQHDGGIVYLPDGRKYVLVLLSKNLTNEERGIATLAEISKLIFQLYNL